MLRNSDVTRFVSSILPNALKGGYAHRTMIAFNAASLHDFIVRSKSLDEGTVAFLLPAALESLQKHSTEVDSISMDSIASAVFLADTLSTDATFRVSLEPMSSYPLSHKNLTLHPKL